MGQPSSRVLLHIVRRIVSIKFTDGVLIDIRAFVDAFLRHLPCILRKTAESVAVALVCSNAFSCAQLEAASTRPRDLHDIGFVELDQLQICLNSYHFCQIVKSVPQLRI